MSRPSFAGRAVAALSGAIFALHIFANAISPYGFQRDEFLYMAMGRHLRLWQMDFPPFIALMSQLERFAFGDSIISIRLFVAVAAALIVCLAALIARELGGGKFAQLLASIAVAASPLFLRAGMLFQPVVFDQLWWTLALFALARLGREGASEDELSLAPRTWILLGVACGVGLLTKFSMLFFGSAMVAAFLIVPQRGVLLTRWPYLAAVIAFLIGSPSFVGQLLLGYPVVAQMKALQGSQLVHVSIFSFVTDQLYWGPAVLLALCGALYLAIAPSMRRYRVVGWTCIGAFALLLVLHGKAYYIGPIYPALFAAGATAFEGWSAARARGMSVALRTVSVVLIVVYAAAILPVELPVFSRENTAAFASRAGMTKAARTNMGTQLRLPQDYADMLGWPEEVALVAHIYDSLPPAKRAQVVIVGENYGEAGALEFYGPRYHLPRVISAAGSYWFFGPGSKPGTIVISLGVTREDLYRFYSTVTPAGKILNEWGVPEESDVSVYVAEQPQHTLQELWPSLAGRN